MGEPWVERVSAAGIQWRWLRDGTAEPAPDALERLTGALAELRSLPSPALLASKVVDCDGAVVPALAPWYRRDDPALAMDAAGCGVLPIRAAGTGSVLVRDDVLDAAGAPRRGLPPGAAALEWTARMLRGRVGYLVPASVAVAADAPRAPVGALDARPLHDLRAGAALLAGRAFSPREKLWLGLEVSLRAAGAGRRARLARASRGSRG